MSYRLLEGRQKMYSSKVIVRKNTVEYGWFHMTGFTALANFGAARKKLLTTLRVFFFINDLYTDLHTSTYC